MAGSTSVLITHGDERASGRPGAASLDRRRIVSRKSTTARGTYSSWRDRVNVRLKLEASDVRLSPGIGLGNSDLDLLDYLNLSQPIHALVIYVI